MTNTETVIGPESRVAGELRGEEDVIVRGRVEGRVQLTHTLTVEEGGIVQADVDVKSLVVSGVLVGTIIASESVRLTETAKVIGDLTSPRVVIEAGAAYRGKVDMGDVEGVRAARGATAAKTDRASARSAPPRMTAPPRAAAAAAAPRMVAPAARPSGSRPAPPTIPRAEGAASAPGWAKKKQVRRR